MCLFYNVFYARVVPSVAQHGAPWQGIFNSVLGESVLLDGSEILLCHEHHTTTFRHGAQLNCGHRNSGNWEHDATIELGEKRATERDRESKGCAVS